MKITLTITLAFTVILAAGCAHEKHQAQYDESLAPNANTSSQNIQYNNQTPNGARNGSESDNALVVQVRQSLQQDPRIAPLVPNIQISANNGYVVLTGSVPSHDLKRQIQSIVAGASGVVIVDDQLQVTGGVMSPTSRSNAGGSIYSNGSGKMNEQEGNQQPANPTANGGNNSVNAAPSGVNNSTNNTGSLNPTSNTTNSLPRIYHDSAGNMNAATNNALSPTSRTNGESQIYQQNQSQNPQMNTNGNDKVP